MLETADRSDVLVFLLRGKLGHFRQPDTTVTQATYPFPPRPTLHGLLGAVLGIDYNTPEWERFLGREHYLGISLLTPVRAVCMQMSLLGKGFVSNDTTGAFNRPTVVEMLVEPKYRVYYCGESLAELRGRLANRQSVFHTYLGSAYCLTFPEFEGIYSGICLSPKRGEVITLSSVVPREMVHQVRLEAGTSYAAARAMPYRHAGDRTFSGTATVFYEMSGKPLKVEFNQESGLPYRVMELPTGEVVCLW
ncbi:MAG: CRISPR-associated protein Cas5 [Bacillota bacterium]